MLMIRRSCSGPLAMLKTTLMTMLVLGGGAALAQPPDALTERTHAPASAPDTQSSDASFHDLICKPNGTEDGFDCADEATPAKIVPIPSQVQWPRQQDQQVSG
jgi:hypothetical protein